MKLKLKTIRKRFLTGFLIAMLSVIAVTCVFLDGIDYPESAEAGETITMTMHSRFEPAEDRSGVRLVIGFMAPDSWNAADNTTVTYTGTYGDGTMSLVPEGTPAPNSEGGGEWPEEIRNKFGIGGNLLDNVEWVVFQSDESYEITNGADGTVDIDITTRVGDQNMLVKLGFFLGNSSDGLTNQKDPFDYSVTNKAEFTKCFEVTGGEGNIIDFCNPKLNVVTPSMTTDNDFITFAYQGDIAANVLENSDPIYLCATGLTDKKNSYEVCETGDKTRMTKASEFQNNWELTMWPRDYFDIGEDETLTEITYYFKDEDGNDLMDEERAEPFSYLFICEE